MYAWLKGEKEARIVSEDRAEGVKEDCSGGEGKVE